MDSRYKKEINLGAIHNPKFTQFWGDAHHDLVNGRYACVNSFYNIGIKDGNGPPGYNGTPDWDYQKPSGLRKRGVR